MHIPDGFVDVPTAVATGAVSLGTVAYAVHKTKNALGDRTIPLLGVTAAFIFAAQMLNFPVAGGTSGHFLGAMLAVALLGVWPAPIVMTVVLVVQALGMADGGITALGANVFNMGVVAVFVGYGVFYRTEKGTPPHPRWLSGLRSGGLLDLGGRGVGGRLRRTGRFGNHASGSGSARDGLGAHDHSDR